MLSQACHVTHYQRHAEFHALFLAGAFRDADALLSKRKYAMQHKAQLLYYLDKGTLAHLMQQYEASNYFFEQAYLTCENFSAKPLAKILAFIIHPTIVDYRGEDHEILLLHYYKTLNFLQLGQKESALVECRRLNIKLNQLSDQYSSDKKYRRDAFIHTLMGLVYQANHEYNNAFIAYRNAIEIYQEDYQHLFGLEAPDQLKKDLIYTAYKTGLYEQVDQYKQEFKLAYDPAEEVVGSDVVFLWNNGLGPVKDKWNINFVLSHKADRVVSFRNEALGLFFTFPLLTNDESKSLSDLTRIRVTLPKYRERPLLYDKAIIYTHDGQQHALEVLEDVNSIAFQVLRQRTASELGKSLLRVALKKAAEYKIKKQNELLGKIVGGIGFATEQADTRNWQTIPHSIYYARLRLHEGAHRITFKAFSEKGPTPLPKIKNSSSNCITTKQCFR
jgi:hypothetical protein